MMSRLVQRSAVLYALMGSVLAASTVTPVRAEWPQRQINILVCFAAGGGTDIAIRLLSNDLSKALGQPVVVVNRPGASGIVAINATTRSPADGYTLVGCSSAFVINPSLYATANYDAIKDFVPVMNIGASPDAFLVPSNSDIKTFDDLVRKAKAGRLNWTSPGHGTSPYMIAEVMRMRLGLEMQHIPFSGAGPAAQATIAGQVDMLSANLSSVGGLLASGSLRAIAQTGKERWPALPDVPTLGELGFENAESETFVGILAPTGTPEAVVMRLAKEMDKILAADDMKERYWKAGLLVLAEGPEAFKTRIAREVPYYRDVIKRVGLEVR